MNVTLKANAKSRAGDPHKPPRLTYPACLTKNESADYYQVGSAMFCFKVAIPCEI